MAVSGAWKARQPTGVQKWGTGVNPVHATRDLGRGREYPVHAPYPGHDLEPMQDSLIDHEDWGYCSADFYGAEGEAELRRVDDIPGWGQHVNRSDIPANYPVPGEPGAATDWRAIPHQSQEEAGRIAAVQPSGYRGGYQTKATGEVNRAVTSSPRQYERNTSMTQGAGIGVMRNDRAVARGGDPRSPIESRSAGMIAKTYAKSLGQGGGPGTPDMRPYQQSGLKRPFFYRSPGLPPPEQHTMNTMEGRQTLAYVAAPDPYPGEPATQAPGDGYGYSEGDYY